MKSYLRLLSIFLFALPLHVQADKQGWYVGGDIGGSFLSDSEVELNGVTSSDELGYDAGVSFSIYGGYDFGVFRTELEHNIQSNDLDDYTGTFPGVILTLEGDLTSYTTLINGYYDFENSSPVTPYLFTGLGIMVIDADDSDSVFAYQFGAGANYSINDNMMIDFKYRYLDASDIDIGDGVEIEYAGSHAVLAGFRYNF